MYEDDEEGLIVAPLSVHKLQVRMSLDEASAGD